jgi:hypothetical protein
MLFDNPGWTSSSNVKALLQQHHYLGPLAKGLAWMDEFGCIVISRPTARNIPNTWLELSRWCITSNVKNAGSRQWACFVKALRNRFCDCTTLVSYSDPSVGHFGALYRACNWWWAPTWHRLRPPPSQNGSWKSGATQSVKDRWVFPLRPDSNRPLVLTIKDKSVLQKYPMSQYKEPGGADYKAWITHKDKHD